jgi:hypothetical protein
MELRDLSSEFISFDLSPEDIASVKGGASYSPSIPNGPNPHQPLPVTNHCPWIVYIIAPPIDRISRIP